MDFIRNLNYVYVVEILVITGIAILIAYVFYAMGIIKKKE